MNDVKQLSAQEIFEKAATHLLKQGERSQGPVGGTCLYRGHAGRMCAVGVLIHDNAYNPDIEGVSCYALDPEDRFRQESDKAFDGRAELLAQALRASGVDPTENQKLLCELQRIHDSRNPARWLDVLTSLGRANHLDTAFLGEVAL